MKTVLSMLATFAGFTLSAHAQQPPPSGPSSATKDAPFTNSLGMKFVPVPGTKVLFCIHDTRKGDYRKYAEANPGVSEEWKNPELYGVKVSEGEDHPVVNVSWQDAKAFCAWLSKKEGRTYRLPTDHEWSVAVGIGSQEDADATPAGKSGKIDNVFPWGRQWPPPKGAGNFADSAAKKKFPKFTVIEGYNDGFATTSPVMSFEPNKLGLYDMGGNVWQWCEDWYDSEQKFRVLRGGSWDYYDRDNLLSSSRYNYVPADRLNIYGFRVVVER
jgi:formylglycine-generating enzyme required for sulfatase activity